MAVRVQFDAANILELNENIVPEVHSPAAINPQGKKGQVEFFEVERRYRGWNEDCGQDGV